MKINLSRIRRFINRDIWRIDDSQEPLAQRLWIGLARRLTITTDGFMRNNLTSYAAALTYSCILAAVPVLAIIFAIARGFDFGNVIEEQLRENISLSPDLADTIFGFIDSYISHTHSGIFLGFGLLMLLYTVVMLTSNIETAFNTIWHVRSSRNIYRRTIDYISVFLILPILIVVTSGFSVFLITLTSLFSDYVILSSTMEFVIKITPMILWCIAFVTLYKLMPNTHVRWRAALVPGLLAGAIFQLVQYLYIHYQIVLSSYNAIYGSFAALPMFMIWLNISWIIILIGAQLCYANQCVNEYAFAKDSQNMSRCDHDSLCILLLQRIAHRFAEGMPSYTTHTLARETGLPHSMVQGLLDELTSAGLISETHDDTGTLQHYLPQQDIHRITINNILYRLDNQGNGRISLTWAQGNADWNRIRQIRAGLATREGETSIADL
ncbi:MAG: YihY/virulence factor BrkB family protein [Bacteroidaceae bacterium]|nr:YihY/virulence factor BrkB family protein [Bacteroidaceae bacterium]